MTVAMIGFTSFLLLVTVAATYLSWVLVELGPCDGDGGSPHAHPGSTVAQACGAAHTATPLLFLGPPALLIAAGVYATRRDRLWPLFAAWVLALAIGVGPMVLILLIDLPEGYRA